MANLNYSEQALADLKRLSDFLAKRGPLAASETIDLIVEAVAILGRHPLIGRLISANLRELNISRGKTGYVAMYSFEEAHDAVLILAIRHQREAGY